MTAMRFIFTVLLLACLAVASISLTIKTMPSAYAEGQSDPGNFKAKPDREQTSLEGGIDPKMSNTAAPFGISIGKTTCAEATKILGRYGERLENGDLLVRANQPEKFYPYAESLKAICPSVSKPVLWFRIDVNEGYNSRRGATRKITEMLDAKYAHVKLDGMPESSETIYTDLTKNTVIVLKEYWTGRIAVTYMNRATFERFEVVKAEQRKAKDKADAEADAADPVHQF